MTKKELIMIGKKIGLIITLVAGQSILYATKIQALDGNVATPINTKNLAKETLEKLNQCIILFTNASNTLNEAAKKQFLDGAVALYKELLKIEKDLPAAVSHAIKDKMQLLGNALLAMLGLKKITEL